MVAIETIRASNAELKSLGQGLVAVFVGATAGIGESTAREFIRNTQSPKVYLIGRSPPQATTLITEFKALNPTANVSFIQSDVSLLKNVDSVCTQVKAQESRINLLFLSQGMMTLAGRTETAEGLDTKFSLHYYSRMRFISNLLPLLQNAANETSAPNLSRVVTVLAAGMEGRLNLSDLSLKHNFSLKACADHAGTMNSLAVRTLAQKYPGISFIHNTPGAVKTSIMRNVNPLLKLVLRGLINLPFIPMRMGFTECGERHAYFATNERYKPRKEGHLLSWDQEETGNEKALGEYAGKVTEDVWNHTEDVFRQVQEKGRYEP